MNNKLADIIAKVKKLLALSTSSNVHEAATAVSLANKLIDEYRLSTSDISDNEEVDCLIEDPEPIYETGRQIHWKVSLIMTLTAHYGCATYNLPDYSSGRMVSRIKLVGRQSDIQIVRYMYSWLHLECQRLSELNGKGKGKVFIQSYCLGFVSGIAEQLKKSREAIKNETNSTALVNLDSRGIEARKFLESLHNLKSTKSNSYYQKDVSAFLSGQIQGKNTHLGQALSGSKVKLLNS